ncbi:hypothetical protein GH733_014511, partial [Mirounga leonina]
MSEERVTYVELKLPYSGKQKCERCPMNRRREFPWHIVALSLGIIFVILLLTITGLIYMHKDYIRPQEKMYCYGKSCYYFAKEEKTWERSKESCQDQRSSLIKIDNKEEE